MSKSPEISVLMPVFNTERYLKQAIDSILSQTFKDFEFVIINDGSTDSSEEIILSYNDSRIKYYKNAENIGLIATLNKGVDLCNGRFVARMDADDISLPERLQKQLDFLNANPQFVMLGGDMEVIDENNQHIKNVQKYCPPHLIRTQLFLESAFAHPTVLIRKDILAEFRYNAGYIHAEDYFLWSQIAFKYPVANLPETLIKYREHQQSVSKKYQHQQQDTVKKIYAYHIGKLNITASDAELELYYKLLFTPKLIAIFDKNERRNIKKWIEKLLKQNELLQVYDQKYFATQLKPFWNFRRKILILLAKRKKKYRVKY
ncbi:MAG: glycosyltransferase [Dysgonamonadaceae bacterium]|jgi:glycosyltransferase involved in cell wall biosynthesis|nr:glycosyltransferase [Dysgonamonadaceae bacterium]